MNEINMSDKVLMASPQKQSIILHDLVEKLESIVNDKTVRGGKKDMARKLLQDVEKEFYS